MNHQPGKPLTLFDPEPLSDIDDVETERTLASMFVDQAGVCLPELGAAIDAADGERLRRLAHRLKGSAATVGAVRVAGLCSELGMTTTGELTPRAWELHALLSAALDDTSLALAAHTAEMLGYRPEHMLGRPVFDFMEAFAIIQARHDLQFCREGKSAHLELPLRRRGGESAWTLFSASPLYDEQGRYVGAMAMVSQLSELRE